MPTPIEILTDPISLIILAIYASLMFWEAFYPARELPSIRFWKVKGLTSFVLFFYLSSYLPLITDPLLESYKLFNLESLGTIGGSILGLLLYEGGVYIWHKAMHQYDFLWRTFHQMHHSAERMDTYGAFFFSPLDMIGFTVLGSICFALLIGITPQAITIVLLTTTFFRLGGQELQINVVDAATLHAAQADPEAYSDLVVRVAGYSAYFTQLGRDVQNEIISRTEQSV